MKEFARKNFPFFFDFARSVKNQLVVEGQVIRQVGLRALTDRFVRRPRNWAKVLPLQKPLCRNIGGLNLTRPAELPDYMRSLGLTFAEGGHTVYLPPETIMRSSFAPTWPTHPSGQYVAS
jgi:hypothetical protein